jgi:hypothetical protein
MNPQPNAILKLEPNTPTELTLKYSNGMDVTGKFGPQVLFTLTGGLRLYVPQEVGEEIRALTLAPGQPFLITKRSVSGQKTVWTVERKHAPQTRHAAPDPVRTATQIEHALKTVIAAACSAEKFGEEIGYSVKFSGEDIRAMANTVLISMGRAAA